MEKKKLERQNVPGNNVYEIACSLQCLGMNEIKCVFIFYQNIWIQLKRKKMCSSPYDRESWGCYTVDNLILTKNESGKVVWTLIEHFGTEVRSSNIIFNYI